MLVGIGKKTILKGQKYCNIYQPKVNWNDAIIDPCINFINKSGSEIKLKSILKNIEVNKNLLTKL